MEVRMNCCVGHGLWGSGQYITCGPVDRYMRGMPWKACPECGSLPTAFLTAEMTQEEAKSASNDPYIYSGTKLTREEFNTILANRKSFRQRLKERSI